MRISHSPRFMGESRRTRRSSLFRYVPAFLVLCVGAALSFALFQTARSWEEQQARDVFEQQLDDITSRLERSLAAEQAVLGSIAGLYAASIEVDRKEFAAFASGVLSRHPHFQALEWIPFVPGSQRTSYEEAAQADGFPGFRFTEREDHGDLKRAEDRQTYFPVYYVEPLMGNEAALGFDLGSSAQRLEALERARDTGAFAATAPITLVQETGRQFGRLVVLPIYRNGEAHDDPEQRRAALAGFALAVCRIGDFVERSLGDLHAGQYHIQLYDMDASEGRQLIYESKSRAGDQSPDLEQIGSVPYKTVTFEVSGRRWSLMFFPTPGQLPGRPIPLASGALVVGLVMSIASAGFLVLAVRQADKLSLANDRLMDEVSERQLSEEALRCSEAKYRELASSVPGIVYQVLLRDGVMSFPFVSEGSYAVAGVAPSEIQADASAILSRVVEEDVDVLNQAIAYSAANMETRAIEFRLNHRDGGMRWVRAVSSPHRLSDGSVLWNCVAMDITERKRAETMLKESEAKYKNIVELATDLIFTSDRDGNFTFMNDAGYVLLEASPEEVIDQPWLKWIHPENRDESAKTFREMLLQGIDVFAYENRFVSKSGSVRNIVSSVRVLWNDRGEIDGFLGISHDITDRKRAEAALVASENRFRSLIEHSSDSILLLDIDGHVTYASPSASRISGYTSDEFRSLGSVFDLIQPQDRDRAVFSFCDLIAKPESIVAIELRALSKEGTQGWIEATVTNMLGEPSVEAMVVNWRDITGRKLVDEALNDSIDQWYATFDAITDPIALMDTDYRIVLCNQAMASLIGKPASETPHGTTCYQVLHGTETPIEGCPFVQMQATGRHQQSITHVGDRTFEEHVHPVKDNAGNVVRCVHILSDITERKQSEEQVQRHVQRLSALRSIDMIITSSLDMRVTLNVLLDQVMGQLGVDAADVLLFDRKTQRLEYSVGKGFRTRALQHTRLRMGEGHAGRAAMERRVLGIPSLAEDPGDLTLAPLLANELFIAYYAVPLVSKGQVKGVLEIFHRSGLNPEPEWLDFLETLAGHAAIAIDNATLFEETQQSNLELAVAYDTTLEGWVRALDLRDKETEGHTQRVTETAVLLSASFGLSESELVHVRRGALLHDIGKTGIPDSILLKQGSLDEQEMEIMRRHPVYAYEFLSPISFLRPAIDIPYCHHERWDGSGYPRGLRGENIPLMARIFAVVDVWDALCSDRPYRPAWPEDKVMKYLRSRAGTEFDPRVVDVFLELLEKDRIQPRSPVG